MVFVFLSYSQGCGLLHSAGASTSHISHTVVLWLKYKSGSWEIWNFIHHSATELECVLEQITYILYV